MVVAGEVTSKAWIDVEALVRKTVLDIGYNSSEMGFICGPQLSRRYQHLAQIDYRRRGISPCTMSYFGPSSSLLAVLPVGPHNTTHR